MDLTKEFLSLTIKVIIWTSKNSYLKINIFGGEKAVFLNKVSGIK